MKRLRRSIYLVHRWIGIGLGLLVFVWFASGIAMIFYPWPAPTESEALGRLEPFSPPAGLESPAAMLGSASAPGADGARLLLWNGRPVYALWSASGGGHASGGLVDARTGAPISPISAAQAVGVARSVAGPDARVRRVALLGRGDHYLLSAEYRHGFPAYRVRFGGARGTSVYVSRRGGDVIGVVTDLTRWTTWLGTVPHWLYFRWLYERGTLWLWASIVLPGIALLGGLTGMTFGAWQLFPRRRSGEWRVSPYRGVSLWHHLAGIIFGTLVVTWAFSGLLEVLGPGNAATGEQVRRVEGPATSWGSLRVGVGPAADLVAERIGDRSRPIAIDIQRVEGRPGYLFHLADGRDAWVDGATGRVSGDIGAARAVRLARRALSLPNTVPLLGADRLTRYDRYYYARQHRQMHLPVWRVAFADAARSTIYLHTVSGTPVGFVDDGARRYRWLRDGLHSLDFPGLAEREPAWQLVLLALVLGGAVSAGTGVWLAVRRLARSR